MQLSNQNFNQDQNFNYPISYHNENNGKHYSDQENLLIRLAIDSGKNFTYLRQVLKRDIKSLKRQYYKINQNEYQKNKDRVSLHKKTIKAIIDILVSHKGLLNEKFIMTENNKLIDQCNHLINRLENTIQSV